MEKEYCETCRFFKGYQLSSGDKAPDGVCRYNPPVFRYWTAQYDPTLCSEEQFPRVNAQDWCGKYERKYEEF